MADGSAEADTFPKLLIRNAQVRGLRPAIRHKDLGIWQTWTWAQVLEEVRAFSVGLDELGLKGGDLSVMLYTSGTTGRSKGVMLTYDNVLISAQNGNAYDRLGENEEVIAYLPLAWIGDHIFSYAQSYVAGFCVNCPETGETVVEDRREIGTTYAFAPPRVYENLLTATMVRMEDASAIKRRMFHFFIDHARKWGEKILNKKPVPLTSRLIYRLGDVLVYGPL